MGRVATTIDRQMELLQERGMQIDDLNKCKEILLDVGYYRLGFYWNYFESNNPNKHDFREGAKFEDVINLYYLDADLRSILLRYIYRIEVNFRTQIIYHVSNANKSPTWFIDPKTVKADCVNYFDEKYTSSFISNNRALKRHHANYINDKYAPAWKTIEFIPFGGVLIIYKNLRDEALRNKISGLYGVKKVSMFENFMSSIVYVRNMCSHAGVLFDLKQPKSLTKIPGHKLDNLHSLWASILAIKFILSAISQNRYKDLQDETRNLFEKYKGDPALREIIESEVGYSFQ